MDVSRADKRRFLDDVGCVCSVKSSFFEGKRGRNNVVPPSRLRRRRV